MQTITHIESNHFRAVVESYAYRKISAAGRIGFLSLIARPGTMRSLLANLYSRTLTTLTRSDQPQHPVLLSLPDHDSGWSFRTFHKPMPSGLLSTLLLPIQATHYGLSMNDPALLIDRHRPESPATPPDQFFSILNKLTPYPILQEWTPFIWQWGLKDGWITPLIADPYPTYVIAPRCKELQQHIAKGIIEQILPVPLTGSDRIRTTASHSRRTRKHLPCT